MDIHVLREGQCECRRQFRRLNTKVEKIGKGNENTRRKYGSIRKNNAEIREKQAGTIGMMVVY